MFQKNIKIYGEKIRDREIKRDSNYNYSKILKIRRSVGRAHGNFLYL